MASISFSITIDGTAADPAIMDRIQQLEVEEHAFLADMLRMRLTLSVTEDGGDWNVDETLFPRLSEIVVSVSADGANAIPIITAYAMETSATFSNEPGQSELELIGMDSSILMNLEHKVRAWPDMSDSDIAETIFGEYGFTPIIDATQPVRQEVDRTVIQNETDIQFLRKLAKRNGFECFVEANSSSGSVEGHFHLPNVNEQPQGVLTVNTGPTTNVNSFEVRFDMLRPTSAQAHGLLVSDQSDQEAEVDSVSITELGGRFNR